MNERDIALQSSTARLQRLGCQFEQRTAVVQEIFSTPQVCATRRRTLGVIEKQPRSLWWLVASSKATKTCGRTGRLERCKHCSNMDDRSSSGRFSGSCAKNSNAKSPSVFDIALCMQSSSLKTLNSLSIGPTYLTLPVNVQPSRDLHAR